MGRPKKKTLKELEFADEDIRALEEMKNDPVLFVKAMFGVEPTEQQKLFLKEACKKNARVSVRSGHGTGKTTTLAWLIHWYLYFHEDCKIPCTAPTAGQLENALWPELSKWHQKYRDVRFKDAIVITSEKMYVRGAERERYAVARTSGKDKPEALQGIRGKNTLVIVDEASGVEDVVFDVVESLLSTEGSSIILCSNPTKNAGYFYNTQNHPTIKQDWTRLHFSSLDSNLVSEKFIDYWRKQYGEDSNAWKIRVLGQFPELNDDSIVSRKDVEDAIGRAVEYPRSEKIAGLDVARFGDDSTAIVIRQGGKIIHIEQWKKYDLAETKGRVFRMYKDGMFDKLFVDEIGVGGGLFDELNHLNVPVIAVYVAEKALESDRYNKLRDELWFNAREFFRDKSSTIDIKLRETDEELLEQFIDQLCSTTYKFTPTAKYKAESKDDMKARGLPSPDLADAFNLTLYNYQVPSKARLQYDYGQLQSNHKKANIIL